MEGDGGSIAGSKTAPQSGHHSALPNHADPHTDLIQHLKIEKFRVTLCLEAAGTPLSNLRSPSGVTYVESFLALHWMLWSRRPCRCSDCACWLLVMAGSPRHSRMKKTSGSYREFDYYRSSYFAGKIRASHEIQHLSLTSSCTSAIHTLLTGSLL